MLFISPNIPTEWILFSLMAPILLFELGINYAKKAVSITKLSGAKLYRHFPLFNRSTIIPLKQTHLLLTGEPVVVRESQVKQIVISFGSQVLQIEYRSHLIH